MESWFCSVTVDYCFFGLFVVVDEWRVGFQKSIDVLQIDLTDAHTVVVRCQALRYRFQSVLYLAMDLVNRRQIAEYFL
jgi:hypothetical protein